MRYSALLSMSSRIELYKMIKTSLRRFPLDWEARGAGTNKWHLKHKNNATEIYKRHSRFLACNIETPVGTIIYSGWQGLVLTIIARRLFEGLRYKELQDRRYKLFKNAVEYFRPWSTNEGRFVEKL